MKHPIIKAGGLLFIFTAISIFIVAWIQDNTKESISYNKEQLILQRLGELVENYDNDILQDKFIKENVLLHGVRQNIKVYPAKRNNQIFAYLFEHTYPAGYNGDIELLTGISVQKTLLGVRVISHKETPGLGDKIDTRKSNWIKQFSGLSLTNPSLEKWQVKRDGGVFDAFTGATITPRAIVNATSQLLNAFEQNRLLD